MFPPVIKDRNRLHDSSYRKRNGGKELYITGSCGKTDFFPYKQLSSSSGVRACTSRSTVEGCSLSKDRRWNSFFVISCSCGASASINTTDTFSSCHSNGSSRVATAIREVRISFGSPWGLRCRRRWSWTRAVPAAKPDARNPAQRTPAWRARSLTARSARIDGRWSGAGR